jgi:hypothetical protein
MSSPKVPVSVGELVDKITILEIKSERLQGDARNHARHEHQLLAAELARCSAPVDPALQAELRAVNQELWTIEDDIRDHERRNDFGASFIALARSVYVTNDRRAAIKRTINERCGSEIMEVKGYQEYR